jgi:hypothetical protein
MLELCLVFFNVFSVFFLQLRIMLSILNICLTDADCIGKRLGTAVDAAVCRLQVLREKRPGVSPGSTTPPGLACTCCSDRPPFSSTP